mmetsp:Transcript_82473/g.229915  ORF Transcript_82473/g.229915 Transcript_82473/m.229915 type:complete len:274 (+) Transcript_82473:421-1242(+)
MNYPGEVLHRFAEEGSRGAPDKERGRESPADETRSCGHSRGKNLANGEKRKRQIGVVLRAVHDVVDVSEAVVSELGHASGPDEDREKQTTDHRVVCAGEPCGLDALEDRVQGFPHIEESEGGDAAKKAQEQEERKLQVWEGGNREVDVRQRRVDVPDHLYDRLAQNRCQQTGCSAHGSFELRGLHDLRREEEAGHRRIETGGDTGRATRREEPEPCIGLCPPPGGLAEACYSDGHVRASFGGWSLRPERIPRAEGRCRQQKTDSSAFRALVCR